MPLFWKGYRVRRLFGECIISRPPLSGLLKHCLQLGNKDNNYFCCLADYYNVLRYWRPNGKEEALTLIFRAKVTHLNFTSELILVGSFLSYSTAHILSRSVLSFQGHQCFCITSPGPDISRLSSSCAPHHCSVQRGLRSLLPSSGYPPPHVLQHRMQGCAHHPVGVFSRWSWQPTGRPPPTAPVHQPRLLRPLFLHLHPLHSPSGSH